MDTTYENGTGYGHGYAPGKNTYEQFDCSDGCGDGHGNNACRGIGVGVLHSFSVYSSAKYGAGDEGEENMRYAAAENTHGYGRGAGDGFSGIDLTGHGTGSEGAGNAEYSMSKRAYGYGCGEWCDGDRYNGTSDERI